MRPTLSCALTLMLAISAPTVFAQAVSGEASRATPSATPSAAPSTSADTATPMPKQGARALNPSDFTSVRSAHDTCETAIALEAADHMSGVEKQYDWLRANHPNHQMVQQEMIDCGGKPTDAMIMANPTDKTYIFVLFDLSGYFGKGMGL